MGLPGGPSGGGGKACRLVLVPRMARKEQMEVEARNGYKDVRFPRTGGSI